MLVFSNSHIATVLLYITGSLPSLFQNHPLPALLQMLLSHEIQVVDCWPCNRRTHRICREHRITYMVVYTLEHLFWRYYQTGHFPHGHFEIHLWEFEESLEEAWHAHAIAASCGGASRCAAAVRRVARVLSWERDVGIHYGLTTLLLVSMWLERIGIQVSMGGVQYCCMDCEW